MRAVVEPLEGNKVKLSVEVDEQEFDKAVDAAAKRLAREVRLPGFRPGKVPRKILEARLGPDGLRQEALRDALPEYYMRAVRDHDVDVIAAPEIDVTSGDGDRALSFDAVVEVRPSVGIPGYQGLRVAIPRPDVTDAEVDAQIDRLRGQGAELRTVQRPAASGDNVTIDIRAERDDGGEPALDATDFLYEVGSGQVVPELDDQLPGTTAGDTLTFDAAIPSGDTLHFSVAIKEVQEKVLPDVTDEWAAEMSEFETVAALREDLRTRIAAVKRVQAQMALREGAVNALVELVVDEVPGALVDAEVQRRVEDLAHRLSHQGATLQQYLEATGQSQQELLDEVRTTATASVKADLALRALADNESLDATEEDVDEQIARLAAEVKRSAAEVRRNLDRGDQMPTVRSDIRKAKAVEWLMEHVEVVDEEGHPVDRAALDPPQPDPADSNDSEESQP